MKQESLDNIFRELKGQFDIETPKNGHEKRFLERLNTNKKTSENDKTSRRFNWKPLLSVAAALVLCLGIFRALQNQPETLDLANVSPELSETQDFFTVTIAAELKKLDSERSPLTQQIINDALAQIEILETDYQKLKTDLSESGKNQRVIYAMISNFQNRIDILNTVLEQIETLKELKTKKNEIRNTI